MDIQAQLARSQPLAPGLLGDLGPYDDTDPVIISRDHIARLNRPFNRLSDAVTADQVNKATMVGKIEITANVHSLLEAGFTDVTVDATDLPAVGAEIGLRAIERGKHQVMVRRVHLASRRQRGPMVPAALTFPTQAPHRAPRICPAMSMPRSKDERDHQPAPGVLRLVSWAEAIRAAMTIDLEADPIAILLGEDTGVYGGASQVTLDLIDRSGPNGAIGTPISHPGGTA
jgi:hypothetical protein